MEIDVREVQFSNKEELISEMLLLRLIDDKDEQRWKAYVPILLTLFGMVIETNEEQLVKAKSPMLLRLFGRIIAPLNEI